MKVVKLPNTIRYFQYRRIFYQRLKRRSLVACLDLSLRCRGDRLASRDPSQVTQLNVQSICRMLFLEAIYKIYKAFISLNSTNNSISYAIRWRTICLEHSLWPSKSTRCMKVCLCTLRFEEYFNIYYMCFMVSKRIQGRSIHHTQ